ncbi:hypothetical protein Glove_37g109 [Diversispora epigaea]|uniref:Protein kinase domain-containing protein n=1 Tax=Diversispora epigaea TaxID=1348612 RepID=A0A397JSK4_9GLOM|nr:hypothetical protein Glove_37g109 [Diversispora epigaea]
MTMEYLDGQFDNFQKENIPFYHYSEFEKVNLIIGMFIKLLIKFLKKLLLLNAFLYVINLHYKRHQKLKIHDSILRFYESTNNYIIILEHANNAVGDSCLNKMTMEYLDGQFDNFQKENIPFYHYSEFEKSTNNYIIILEHANNGSLRQYLIKNFQKMDWNEKLNLVKHNKCFDKSTFR